MLRRRHIFRQRVLALTKQGKQERVGFSDGIVGRVHEAALDLVPLRDVTIT